MNTVRRDGGSFKHECGKGLLITLHTPTNTTDALHSTSLGQAQGWAIQKEEQAYSDCTAVQNLYNNLWTSGTPRATLKEKKTTRLHPLPLDFLFQKHLQGQG